MPGKLPNGACVGTADLYDMHRKAGVEAWGADVPSTHDYRELLDRKDVDAVIVAVADFQHRRVVLDCIAAGKSQHTYRGIVTAHRKATGARNFTACDSLLIGDKCGAHTVPYIEAKNSSATFEHEATTSKISEDVLFYCVQRGLSQEEAVGLVVNGFVKDVLQQLPMEFAVEAQKLISISLEGSVG